MCPPGASRCARGQREDVPASISNRRRSAEKTQTNGMGPSAALMRPTTVHPAPRRRVSPLRIAAGRTPNFSAADRRQAAGMFPVARAGATAGAITSGAVIGRVSTQAARVMAPTRTVAQLTREIMTSHLHRGQAMNAVGPAWHRPSRATSDQAVAGAYEVLLQSGCRVQASHREKRKLKWPVPRLGSSLHAEGR